MTDLATMLRQQMSNNLNNSLDSAVQVSDINGARKAVKDMIDLAVASVPRTAGKAPITTDQIKAALLAKAPWFGVDPRKSAKAAELGKTLLPERFDNAEAFADALLKAVEEDGKPAPAAGEGEDADGEDGEDADEDEDADDEEAAKARREARRNSNRRNGSQQQELRAGNRADTGSNLRRAFDTGDIKHLPKAAADDIKKSADKFTRNGSKEQRAAFISNAVKTRARADLIATGKFDAKSNKFK